MNNPQHRRPKRRPTSIRSLIGLIIIAILAYIFDIDQLWNDASSVNRIPVELIQTIDGDTIKIQYNGQKENVRYLLIDTPEINHQQQNLTEACAMEAKERNRQLLESGQIEIEFEEDEERDKYNRLLAYLYVDGKSIQETLLEEGYARVAYVYNKEAKHLDQFRKAEKQAKQQKMGVWAVEGYATNRGFNTKVIQNTVKPCQ